jgi:hypothetical protein
VPRRLFCVTSVVLLGLLGIPSMAAAAELGPHDLVDLSRDLVTILNRGDHGALAERLTPALREKYPPDVLRAELVECRVLTHEIFRLSLPSWGARHFGFFGVYAETGQFQLVLEIDQDRKIRHLVITDDMTAGDQQCRIGALD